VNCADGIVAARQRTFAVTCYNLDATLGSGQAFRWERRQDAWEGVVGRFWVRLTGTSNSLRAETAESPPNWEWLTNYLQTEVELEPILLAFPADEPMKRAVTACHGLRLLRQDPWECLASFILSSTKQIVQIQQIVRCICERFGERIPTAQEHGAAYTFPTAERIAQTTEVELRACKMGFRAPYLLAAARTISRGEMDLTGLSGLPTEQARQLLMQLDGVGRKIADCVLLFAYGRQDAFPVDVWVTRALQELYFPKRRVRAERLLKFSQTYFGRYAGYAQQYLFHYIRTFMTR